MSSADSYTELLDATKAYFDDWIADPENNKDLELVKTDDEGNKLWARYGSTGGELADCSLVVLKGVLKGDMPTQPFEKLWNADERCEWDDGYTSFKTVEEVDENTRINHSVMKAPGFMISAREFCVVATNKFSEGDDKLVIVQASVEHEKAPVDSSNVRADTRTVNIFEKTDNGIAYTFAGQSDPKGSIPSWVVNQTVTGTINIIEKLNKANGF